VHFFVDLASEGILGNIEVIIHLESQPERSRVAEEGREAKSSICRYAALTVDYLVDSARGDTKLSSELVLADAHGLQEFLQQDFSRVYWWYLLHYSIS
jgi:hypothetical protein